MAEMTWSTLLLLVIGVLLACGGQVPVATSFDADPLDPNMNWYQPFERSVLNFSSMETGEEHSSMLNQAFIVPVVYGSTNEAYGRPVLIRQTRQQPSRWLMLEVNGWEGDQAMLAIRKDNLYIVGFAARTGHWFVFHNRARLIPGATVLDSEDTYRGHVGGGYRNLGSLKLGWETSARAVATLANYGLEYSGDADNGCLTRAVAILAVTICEAARFDPIVGLISNGWATGVYFEGHQELVVNWKRISCALMLFVQHGGTSAEAEELHNAFGITTAQDAAALVRFLLWPMDNACSEKNYLVKILDYSAHYCTQ